MATVRRNCKVVSKTVQLFDRLGNPAMHMNRQIFCQGKCNAKHHERKGECGVRAPVQANIVSSRSSGRMPDVSKSECEPDVSKRSSVCEPYARLFKKEQGIRAVCQSFQKGAVYACRTLQKGAVNVRQKFQSERIDVCRTPQKRSSKYALGVSKRSVDCATKVSMKYL